MIRFMIFCSSLFCFLRSECSNVPIPQSLQNLQNAVQLIFPLIESSMQTASEMILRTIDTRLLYLTYIHR